MFDIMTPGTFIQESTVPMTVYQAMTNQPYRTNQDNRLPGKIITDLYDRNHSLWDPRNPSDQEKIEMYDWAFDEIIA